MIIITGLPGAGKTVQGQLVHDRLGFHWLSTGQLFRETNDSEIKAIMETGGLVNDDQVSKMVGDKLREIGYDTTFLLDGYPRTVAQAKWLLDHAEEIGKHIRVVLYLVVSDEIAMERLGERGRTDDSEKAIARRRKEALKIAPTVEKLEKSGVPIEEINADGTIEEIFEAIKQALSPYVEVVDSREQGSKDETQDS